MAIALPQQVTADEIIVAETITRALALRMPWIDGTVRGYFVLKGVADALVAMLHEDC